MQRIVGRPSGRTIDSTMCMRVFCKQSIQHIFQTRFEVERTMADKI